MASRMRYQDKINDKNDITIRTMENLLVFHRSYRYIVLIVELVLPS